MGRRCLSRSSCLTCLGVSPSIRPFTFATLSVQRGVFERPHQLLILTGDAQHFFQRGLALHHLRPPIVAMPGLAVRAYRSRSCSDDPSWIMVRM